MRDVKFKAYTPNGMVDVIIINTVTKMARFEDEVLGIQDFSIEESPLLQYTGLKDKNDNEIYEGDIVKCEESNITCKVIFQKAMFMLEWKENDELQHYGLEAFTLEVIGNIYENAELLEEN